MQGGGFLSPDLDNLSDDEVLSLYNDVIENEETDLVAISEAVYYAIRNTRTSYITSCTAEDSTYGVKWYCTVQYWYRSGKSDDYAWYMSCVPAGSTTYYSRPKRTTYAKQTPYYIWETCK